MFHSSLFSVKIRLINCALTNIFIKINSKYVTYVSTQLIKPKSFYLKNVETTKTMLIKTSTFVVNLSFDSSNNCFIPAYMYSVLIDIQMLNVKYLAMHKVKMHADEISKLLYVIFTFSKQSFNESLDFCNRP